MKKIIKILCILLLFSMCLFSCKKEPVNSEDPQNILQNLINSQDTEFFNLTEIYDGEKKLDENIIEEKFGEENFELSSLEKYAVCFGDNNTVNEVGVFKLYDASMTEKYVNLANERIEKLRYAFIMSDTKYLAFTETANNGEVRTYGNYVYYVISDKKDDLFKIIEDILQGER